MTRMVHFSHRGVHRFGVLLADERVVDLTHYFRNESDLRSAGESGQQTVREAVERADLRRSVGGHIYSLGDVVIEHVPPDSEEEVGPYASSDDASSPSALWADHTRSYPLRSEIGMHLARRVRGSCR